MNHPKTSSQFIRLIESKLQQYVARIKPGAEYASTQKIHVMHSFKIAVGKMKLEDQEFWGYLENKVYNGIEAKANNDIADTSSVPFFNPSTPDRLKTYYLTVFRVQDGVISFRFFSFELTLGKFSSKALSQLTLSLEEVHTSYNYNSRGNILYLKFHNSANQAEAFIGSKDRFKYYESKFHPENSEDEIIIPSINSVKKVIHQALKDIQVLYPKSKMSAVDRAHTALHGILQELVEINDLQDQITETLPSLNHLYKVVKPIILGKIQNHRSKELADRILNGYSSIFQKYSEIRNNNTLAHPSEDLIDEDEAELMVQTAMVILKYLDKKI